MADENTNPQDEQQEGQPAGEEQASFTREEMQAYADEQAKGLKAKLDEVLGEKKSAAQKARELEQRQAEEEKSRLAEKEEFKTLWEKEQEEKRSYQDKLSALEQRIKDAEIGKASASIAGQLSSDTKRAALLAEKAAKYIAYNDDGTVSYEMGGVAVGQEKLVQYLREEYDFLADGKNSTGGGAPGSRGVRDAEAKNTAAEQAYKARDVGGYLKASFKSR